MAEQSTESSALFADPRSQPMVHRYQKHILDILSKNKKSPILAEMARELLAGNISLRQVMATESYAEALMAAGGPTLAKSVAMSDKQKAAAVRQGDIALDELDSGQSVDSGESPWQKDFAGDKDDSPATRRQEDARHADMITDEGWRPDPSVISSSGPHDTNVDWIAPNLAPNSVRNRSSQTRR